MLPERCDVIIPPVVSHGVGAGGRFRLRLEVVRSHVVALCLVDKTTASVFEIADVVRSALAFPVDYIAFQNRGAYEIVLDTCINNKTGETLLVPIFEPTLETGGIGLCFDAHGDKSKIIIPWAAAAVPELPTALHDLTSAVRYPRRTFEYCRMAAEVVRRHFDLPRAGDHRKRQREGELAMCAALRLARKSLQSLDAVAARSRHGALVVSMNWEMRKRALEFGWELVARFTAHLEGKRDKQWELLDVRFEE